MSIMTVTRILHVFTIMNRGGSESMIMNYYRNINRDKVQFDFLVHRPEDGAFDKEIKSLGGRIYRMDPINILKPQTYYKQLRSFFQNHPEYKIIHSHLNTFSKFPLKIAEEFKLPIRISHAHTAMEKAKISDVFEMKEGYKSTLKKFVKLFLRRDIHKYTTHRMACGEKAGKWLYGENKKFEILNNAIDLKSFSPNGEIRKQYRTEYSLTGKLVIGHIGSFNSMKNHSFLLKVFKEISKTHKNATLVLAGDGGLRTAIEEECVSLGISNSVIFLGVKSDIPAICQMLDVFIFPSIYEGLPVTLIEAQAAGLNILASDSITREVDLTEDIEYLSISLPPKAWADRILEMHDGEKSNNYDLLASHGYDVITNARSLEKFYLSAAPTLSS